ncbi:hypothetical protein [Agromyces rhizosphaerae]|uniref:hypothetical protein n=1 Tax=Agromyces rhizosphaerae TaxID=88374 RepID=UPI00249164C2|nr:hypothetical protein [Agromyces rhizosphaerae]
MTTIAVVLVAVGIPVTAAAIDRHEQQVALELAQREAAAERLAAAEVAVAVAAVKQEARAFDAGFEGLSTEYASVLGSDEATAFEAARAGLAEAIADGGEAEVSAAVQDLTDAFDALLASVAGRVETIIDANPLADETSTSALTTALDGLGDAVDAWVALEPIAAAASAVVASQDAAVKAAEAAAAAAAERQLAAGSYSGDVPIAGDGVPPSYVPMGWGGTEPAVMELEPVGGIDGFNHCGPGDAGKTLYVEMMWEARPGNTVDIYYAVTNADVRATSGFVQLVSNGPERGTVMVPRPCSEDEAEATLLTIDAYATNEWGTSYALSWSGV